MPVPTDLVTLSITHKALSRVLDPTLNGPGSVSFRLAWTVAEVGVQYRVQMKTSAGSVWADVALTPAGAAAANVFCGGILAGGANPTGAAIAFDLRVRGENGSGNSAWITLTSQNSGAAPASAGDLSAPTSLAFSSITDTSALLTITESESDESAYRVDVYLADDDTYLFTVFVEWLADHVPPHQITLESLAPETTYRVDVRAIGWPVTGAMLSGAITSSTFTTAVDSGSAGEGMDGPTTIVGRIFSAIAGDFTLDPAPPPGEAATWSISGGPAGVTVTGMGTDNVTGRIGGEPSEAGLFDAIVSATWEDTGVIQIAFASVRFLIDGETFLSWLNEDPGRFDLQADMATRELKSTKVISEQEGLWLKYGDKLDAWLIFRDRARVLAPTLDALRLKLSLADNFDAPPLLDLRPDPLTVVFLAGHRVYRLTAALTNPVFDRLFAALNAADATAAATQDCDLELSWRIDGQWTSTRPLKVTLAQDYVGT